MSRLSPLNVSIRMVAVFFTTIVALCWWIAPSHSADKTQSPPAPNTATAPARRVINDEGSAVNLHESLEINTEYRGDEQLIEVLRQNLASPLSLASGDFDEDGVPGRNCCIFRAD